MDAPAPAPAPAPSPSLASGLESIRENGKITYFIYFVSYIF